MNMICGQGKRQRCVRHIQEKGKDTTLLGYAEEPEYLVVSAYDNTAERVEVRCYSVTGTDVKRNR